MSDCVCILYITQAMTSVNTRPIYIYFSYFLSKNKKVFTFYLSEISST